MSQVALPFLTLSNISVIANSWMISQDDKSWKPLSGQVDHWDYARDILLTRQFELNFEKASTDLLIPLAELKLGLLVRTGTGYGTLPKLLTTRRVLELNQETPLVSLTVPLAGNCLSRRLYLETLIFLAGPAKNGSKLSPMRVGSKLWRNVHDLRLEGEGPRFPIEAVSFSSHFVGRAEEHALWYLHWSPSALHLDFAGAVRLYLNSDRADFIERMLNTDSMTVQAVVADVMGQMICAVVVQDEIDEVIDGYEADTIGGQIKGWMDKIFPGQSPQAIRETLIHRPGLFRSMVQASADFGGLET